MSRARRFDPRPLAALALLALPPSSAWAGAGDPAAAPGTLSRALAPTAAPRSLRVVLQASPPDAPVPRSPSLAPPAAAPGASKPYYRTWWFWTAVGVLAVGAAVAVAAATGPPGPPDTTLGNMRAF